MEEDEFGLSNISLIEDEVKEKVNVIPIVDYTPKIDEKLWFMNKGQKIDNNNNNNNNKKKKNDKIKKNSIKNCQFRIDHYYYNKKYIECIEELNFLKTLVKLKKKQDYNDDIIDVEIRCNFKLNNYDNVISLIKNVETTLASKNIPQFKDQNLLHLLAQSYHFKELFNESIKEYHRLLTVNRRIWEWWFNISLAYLKKPLNIFTKENLKISL
ncbi:hypothetical protein DICPUDRAFT_41082 [Dictyostelium purpureum]|uniref:Uncharacterized protein n=1 Tax=Dictyostelium purpureum TaxID=5786 RepID=F0ZZD8_DICPU|nr:uncharacterized protein DICPUDRAFT_41082 [Dictyostelium purpureum]EGC30689.1 hypothetical protein DICPUDRAFT_41082 [Dictyostelium purpureum]|eukprot:XP_003292787.1 hypothetical protein DICPUDRAFT_41082 [Dictyostelium purpureum]